MSSIHYPGLGGLRGIAAIWVFLLHAFDWNFHGYLSSYFYANRLITRGYLAVDLFFILSGFLLYSLYDKKFSNHLSKSQFIEFMSRRLARILPTLCAASTVILVMNLLNGKPVFLPYLTDLLFLSSLPSLKGLNGPAWSISAEMICYLALPFAIRCVTINQKTIYFIIMASVCSMITLIYRNGSVDNHTFIRAIPGFCGGIVAGYYRWRISKTLASLACGVALIAILLLPIQWHADVIAITAFVVIVLATSQGFASSFLDSALFKWLGDTSYSLYLFHPIMFVLVGQYLFRSGISHPVIWVCLVGLVTLLIASASFSLFESKLRKFWRVYYIVLSRLIGVKE